MLADILEQRARLINTHGWCYSFEVHMSQDDYHRLFAEIMKTGYGYYLENAPGCNRFCGMEIVIDDSETPCVMLAE